MFSTVLIDLDVFVKIHGKNLTNLLEKIHYSETLRHDKAMLGVILVIHNAIKEKMEKMDNDRSRIFFLNSGEFIDGIVFHSYILYRDKVRVCEIINYDEKFLEKILDAIMTGFTGDTIVCIFVPEYDDISRYNIFSSLGFKDPQIVRENLSGKRFGDDMVGMLRKNSIFEEKGNVEDVRYVLENKGASVCKMKIRFSPKTVQCLKKLPDVGFEFGKDGTLTQRELSGKFSLTNMGDYFSVNMDDNMSIGGETDVENMTNRYNFHTHPRGAYALYKVKHGFPSAQDYKSFLKCVKEFNTAFHIIVSLEGIYVISVSADFVHSLDGLNSGIYDFVSKNFEPHREINDTIEKYIFNINGVLYDNKRIFDVVFLDWKNITKNIRINYAKFDLTCFASDFSKNGCKFFKK